MRRPTLQLSVLLLTVTTALVAAQGPGPAGGRGPGGRGPAVTTVDLGGGLTLISAGSNSVLAAGRDGAILVDTTFGGPAFVAKVADVTRVPVRTVINTHSHPDHTGANADFGRQGARIVSTANAATRMAMDFPSPRGGFDPAVPADGRPKDTFTDRTTVTVDGQRAEVVALPPAHTDGDAYVYFPAANVLVMGDLHHSNEYPVYDADSGCRCGSFDGNLRAYDAMLAAGNERTTYIPGHGGPTTKAEVTAYVAMLRRVRDQVTALIAQGRTADDVVAAKLLADDRSPTSPGPDNRDQFVRTLYNALKTGQGR